MLTIHNAVINSSLSYIEYRKLITDLLEEGKTTGENQSEANLNYTNMNVVRMNRLDKTVKLREGSFMQLKAIQQPMTWLVITEAWCGDAAQIIPVLNSLAVQNENIRLRMVLRDEHPELMDKFLTEGARSIPKVIFLDSGTNEVLGSWGPRPEEAEQMTLSYKICARDITDPVVKKSAYGQYSKNLQKWYARNKSGAIQEEFMAEVLRSVDASTAIAV